MCVVYLRNNLIFILNLRIVRITINITVDEYDHKQSMDQNSTKDPGIPTGTSPAGTVPRLSTTELFRGHSRIEIEHKGETYRLQITRQGKLILTK